MNNKIISWINNTKALSIIAVFFAHCQLYYGSVLSPLNWWILPWYVNAFFFVSGYLLFWKQLSAPRIEEDRKSYILIGGGGNVLVVNIFYRIIIPSVIFSIIEFVPSCIIQGRGMDWGYALFKTIGGGTYWFTSALVVSELVLFLLFCSRKRNIWFYVIVCLALCVIGLILVRRNMLNNNIWMWKHGLIALIFLAMGGLYWKYEMQIDRFMKWWFVLPLIAMFIAIVIGLKGYNDPLISTLTIQPLGFLSSAIACLLLVWLCKKLPEIKTLTFIGQNSIGFYFMSGALPITFSLLAHKMVANSTIWIMLLVWISCLVVAYIVVIIINKWLPWLWDLRKFAKAQSQFSNKSKHLTNQL